MHCVTDEGKCSLEMSDKGKRNGGVRNIGSSITIMMYKEAVKDIKCHKVHSSKSIELSSERKNARNYHVHLYN